MQMSSGSSSSRVAVIGSGISGMAAAYLLSARYEVTLYEKNAVVGGHSRTLTVQHGDRLIPVDTGFIVFNHATYPELIGLFAHLGVATQPSDMSFAFSSGGGAFEWGAAGLDAVFAQRSNLFSPRFYALLADIARFFRLARRLATAEASNETLGEWLAVHRFSLAFEAEFLLPLAAAIWSCPADTMRAFPAVSFARFFANHGLLSFTGQHPWYTVTGGSVEYVNKIIRTIARILTRAPVARVMHENGKPCVITQSGDRQSYDHVVLAAHADEALGLIDSPTEAEQKTLQPFRYQENVAVLHSDERIMPRRTACWSSWNYTIEPDNRVSVTYWMNRLQAIDRRYPLFVTLNPNQPIAEDKIFDRHRFTHPVFTAEAMAAQADIPSIQGIRNLWFCGAYQGYGFHEDGLQSAVRVAQLMGVSIPWH